MAQCTERPDGDGNSSLISDVFGYVARELNQFVATATGGSVAVERRVSSHRRSILQRNSSHIMCSDSHQRDMLPDDSLPSNSAVEAADPKQARSRYPHKHISTMPGALFPMSPTLEPVSPPSFEQCIVAAPVSNSNQLTGEKGSRRTCKSNKSHEGKPAETIARSDVATSEVLENRFATDGEIVDGEVNSGKEKQEREMKEERSRDKEKIRCLEAEIRRLKEELSRKDITPILPPPPPPPPPMRNHNARDLNSLPSKFSDPLSLISSARAALKRAPTPIEAPINPRISTKRQGLPSVGVPPDKMAAFLNELKNVRLRKVRQSSKQAPSMANVSANTSVCAESCLSFGDHSMLLDRTGVNSTLSTKPAFDFIDLNSVRAGSKRKREFLDDSQRRPLSSKMKPTIPIICAQMPIHSGTSSAITMTASSSGDNVNATFDTWPSIYSTDITTPSLISDNDHERDDISSIEHIPRTPPEAQPPVVHHIRETRGAPEIIDVDAYVKQEKRQTSPPQRSPSQAPNIADLLSRRAPTSPLPNNTPRKPLPPSRILRSPPQDGVGDSAHSLTRKKSVGQLPKRDFGKAASPHPFAQHSKRWCTRLRRKPEQASLLPISDAWHDTSPHTTLEDELRRAVKSLESIGAEPIIDDEESGILTGTGIREKTNANDKVSFANGINTRHCHR